MNEHKQRLIDLAIEAIKRDLDSGDVTALETLLESVPNASLIAFLPEVSDESN